MSERIKVMLTAGSKDWDDELLAGKLTLKYLNQSILRGELFIAEHPRDKAFLLYAQTGSFEHVFDAYNCIWYSSLKDPKGYTDLIKDLSKEAGLSENDNLKEYLHGLWEIDAKPDNWQSLAIIYSKYVRSEKVSNCTIKPAYTLYDEQYDHKLFIYNVKFASNAPDRNIQLTGSIFNAVSRFKEQLATETLGTGFFNGKQHVFDKLVYQWQKKAPDIAYSMPAYGYDENSGVWIFPNFGLANGEVLKPDKFGVIRHNGKFITTDFSDAELKIVTSKDLDSSWFNDFNDVCGMNGLIFLAWLLGDLFFKQMINRYASYPMMELTGKHGAGKSFLLRFGFKLLGRNDYEGFNPSTGSPVGAWRMIQQVSNYPCSLIEAQSGEGNRKFDYEELLPCYNGGIIRPLGKNTKGTHTNSGNYKAAPVISQNNPITGTPALLSRFIRCPFDKKNHTPENFKKARNLEKMHAKDLCGFMQRVITSEKYLLKNFDAQYDKILERFSGNDIENRIAHNHAQIGGWLHMLALVITEFTPELRDKAIEHLFEMCKTRQGVVEQESQLLIDFWENYYLATIKDGQYQIDPPHNSNLGPQQSINHSKNPELIAIQIAHYYQHCRDFGRLPMKKDLIAALKESKVHEFVGYKAVKSAIFNENVRCYVFKRPENDIRDEILNNIDDDTWNRHSNN